MPIKEPSTLLKNLFDAAIASAQPSLCLPQHLPSPPTGRVLVIGAGKASAAMAKAVEQHWLPKGISIEGLVVTRYGHRVDCEKIDIVEASHPVPNEAGLAASQRILRLLEGLSENDLVLCLLSGGGSALLPLPAPGMTLAEKIAINNQLLSSGASISEINCVRRHLSAIKGGRLAAACYPAKVVTLAISDVPGDALLDIASGPTVADSTTCADALAIVKRFEISLPSAAQRILENGQGESIKPDDPRLAQNQVTIIATPQKALDAVAKLVRTTGIEVHILSDAIEGEAKDVGKVLASIALHVAKNAQPFRKPCVLLSGGETSVSIRGNGMGGRNVECLLAMGIALNGQAHVYAIAGDTDGVDGQGNIAGAILTPNTLSQARQCGLDPKAELHNNNGHGFFSAIGGSVITGPTLTNVNDFRAILITQ